MGAAGKLVHSSGTTLWLVLATSLQWVSPTMLRAQSSGERSVETAPAANDRATGSAKREAARLTAKAERLYLLGQFEAALAHYQDAYQAVPAPELLFNLGQCHKKLAQHRQAAFFFDLYLQQRPDAEHRALVEDLLAEARRKSADTPTSPRTDQRLFEELAALPVGETPEAMPPAPVQPTSRLDAPDERSPLYRRWWLWTAVGAAVVAGVTAVAVTVPRRAEDGSGSPDPGSLGVVDWR